MSCCGDKRQAASGWTVAGSSGGQAAPVPPRLFVYTGASSLRVLGPVTGVLYRFDNQGAVAWVDGLDVPYLLAVPNLRPAAS
jgi:hypothetical protein